MKLKIERTDRIFVSGRSGTGKTYLAKEIVRKNQAYNFFILDMLGNYYDLNDLPNTAIFTIDPLDTERINKIIIKGIEIGAFFILDEMHSFPFTKYKALRFLILAGRNKGSGWLGITQFTSQIPKYVIGNANISFLFANYEKNVLKYLTETYEVTEEELRSLNGHEFYLADYSQIRRNAKGEPIKFILA